MNTLSAVQISEADRRTARRFHAEPTPLTDFGAFECRASAYRPLRPADNLVARIARIWSPTYRVKTVIEYPVRVESMPGQFLRYDATRRTFTRAEAAVELRRIRALGAWPMRMGGTFPCDYAAESLGAAVSPPWDDECDDWGDR